MLRPVAAPSVHLAPLAIGRAPRVAPRAAAVALLLLLLAVVAPGCLLESDGEAGAGGAETPAAAFAASLSNATATIDYTCPPGGKVRGDLCVSTLSSFTASLQEADLAAHPRRAGTLALGVNEGATEGVVSQDGATLVRVPVFVSEDGGASWTRRAPSWPRLEAGPYPLDIAGAGDPSILFDELGVLHVTFIASRSIVTRGADIVYVSSPDLGRTWSDPVVLTDAGVADRNWLSLAPTGQLVLSWWETEPAATAVAWSDDGGKTWQGPARKPGCTQASRVAFSDDEWLLACAAGDAVHVLRVDTTATALLPAGRVAADHPTWPKIVSIEEALLLVWQQPGGYAPPLGWVADEIHVATSADRGASWMLATELTAALGVDDAWYVTSVGACYADASGLVHLVLMGVERTLPINVGTYDHPETLTAAHVVLDHAGRLLHERLLRRDLAPPDPDAPTLGPPWGEHTAGLAFDGQHGLLAWAEDRAIRMTAFSVQR